LVVYGGIKMGIFGGPNIEKLKASKNVKGLTKALKDKDSGVREQAAEAILRVYRRIFK
jgi:HEAT repeat protein